METADDHERIARGWQHAGGGPSGLEVEIGGASLFLFFYFLIQLSSLKVLSITCPSCDRRFWINVSVSRSDLRSAPATEPSQSLESHRRRLPARYRDEMLPGASRFTGGSGCRLLCSLRLFFIRLCLVSIVHLTSVTCLVSIAGAITVTRLTPLPFASSPSSLFSYRHRPFCLPHFRPITAFLIAPQISSSPHNHPPFSTSFLNQSTFPPTGNASTTNSSPSTILLHTRN